MIIESAEKFGLSQLHQLGEEWEEERKNRIVFL